MLRASLCVCVCGVLWVRVASVKQLKPTVLPGHSYLLKSLPTPPNTLVHSPQRVEGRALGLLEKPFESVVLGSSMKKT